MTDPSKAWKYKPPLAGKLVRSVQGASNLAGRSKCVNRGSLEIFPPRETDLREFRECRAALLSAKAVSTSLLWNLSMSNSSGS